MIDSGVEAYFPTLSQAIALNTGLNFPEERWDDLNRALARAAVDLGFQDVCSYAKWLLEPLWSANRIDDLAPYITIGETHFFRDRKLFQALEEQILPELVKTAQLNGCRLRFWSAGCATGEEPYSVAMLVDKFIRGSVGWNVSVLATDINRRALEKARDGVYTSWSFREVPHGIRESYFRENGDGTEIIENIKRMVRFEFLNLAKDIYPHSGNDTETMNLIFCRNVLMYFTAERQERVVDSLCRSLANRGWLIVSPAEAAIVNNSKLVPADIPGAVVFQKVSRRSYKRKRLPIVESSANQTPADGVAELNFCWWSPSIDPVTAEPPQDSCDNKSVAQPLVVTENEAPGDDEAVRFYEQGLYSEAAERLAFELEASQWQGPERDFRMSLLIRSCGNQGKLDEALKWAEKALAVNVLNAEHHYLSGMILQAKGMLDEAAVSLNRAVFLDPNFVVAHFALANLAFLRGDRKESDRYHKTALRALDGWADDEIVPASDGMTAGRLKALITTMSLKEKP